MILTFGKRLAALRKFNRLERKDLAEMLNISYSALSNYENNLRFPDQEILIKIADYFDVSIDYLLGRKDIKNIPDDIANEKHSTYLGYIDGFNLYDLSLKNQERIMDYIKMIRLLEDNDLDIEK